jgi:hypothetical protein
LPTQAGTESPAEDRLAEHALVPRLDGEPVGFLACSCRPLCRRLPAIGVAVGTQPRGWPRSSLSQFAMICGSKLV